MPKTDSERWAIGFLTLCPEDLASALRRPILDAFAADRTAEDDSAALAESLREIPSGTSGDDRLERAWTGLLKALAHGRKLDESWIHESTGCDEDEVARAAGGHAGSTDRESVIAEAGSALADLWRAAAVAKVAAVASGRSRQANETVSRFLERARALEWQAADRLVGRTGGDDDALAADLGALHREIQKLVPSPQPLAAPRLPESTARRLTVYRVLGSVDREIWEALAEAFDLDRLHLELEDGTVCEPFGQADLPSWPSGDEDENRSPRGARGFAFWTPAAAIRHFRIPTAEGSAPWPVGTLHVSGNFFSGSVPNTFVVTPQADDPVSGSDAASRIVVSPCGSTILFYPWARHLDPS